MFDECCMRKFTSKRSVIAIFLSIVMVVMTFVLLNGKGIAHAAPSHPSQAAQSTKTTIAIVIDDFGNNMKGTDDMLNLPVPITVAVMPFLQTSAKDAEKAHQMGHDVIVHMPMEPKSGKASWLGPGAVLANMTDAEIEKRVREAIAAVPHAVGMNNHMGSKVTADKRIMRVVLKVCKEKGLYFLDSRTNFRSIVGEVGQEVGVKVLNNHLFFDQQYTLAHINKQWAKLIEMSNTQPITIAIGHVGVFGPKTASVLRSSIPNVTQKVRFVRVSDLVKEQQSTYFQEKVAK
ncbi:divergent polysaccharide deacetylase family protein [Paenibacillus agilis]|uniref:Divergent polysaccharide deacetylase family protein n=1 Tax=Paenibacillus agilis TaxID=3020863 RepID=A0A559IYC3_9BACL|nr:divergent polysaccharide deacetylase family protein [Paenibacillus agilis]TVX92618.1 divergent polysaccharide deacetylase family protein [Paenibacillus agilis]